MIAQHTPGPWRVNFGGYVASEQHGYVPLRSPFRSDAFVDGPTRADIPEETLQANARLIAAAPEMLEAAQHMVWWTDAYSDHPWFLSLNEAQRAEYQAGYEKARAAIAKAEGSAG